MAISICNHYAAQQVDSATSAPLLVQMTAEIKKCALKLFSIALLPSAILAQADPASEPAVLAIAKVLPAVVNINTERVVRRQVRDPFEDFAAQFFGGNSR